MIAFTCDGCGASLKIADKWSGRLGHCPHCGTDSPVPGYPRRTPKSVIIARIGCFPMLIAVSWGIMFSLVSWESCWIIIKAGMFGTAGIIFFLWAIVNIGTFLYSPRYYLLWRKGGGDPFFDSIHSPLNNDPPEVRYQELYREKERMEREQMGIRSEAPPASPDSTRGIDDPNII